MDTPPPCKIIQDDKNTRIEMIRKHFRHKMSTFWVFLFTFPFLFPVSHQKKVTLQLHFARAFSWILMFGAEDIPIIEAATPQPILQAPKEGSQVPVYHLNADFNYREMLDFTRLDPDCVHTVGPPRPMSEQVTACCCCWWHSADWVSVHAVISAWT